MKRTAPQPGGGGMMKMAGELARFCSAIPFTPLFGRSILAAYLAVPKILVGQLSKPAPQALGRIFDAASVLE